MSSFNVRVIAGSNGEVVQTNPNKPEYGSIQFEQDSFNVRRGFLNKRRKVAFLAGTVEQLLEFARALNLRGGIDAPGCLYVVESNTPFYEGQQAKMNPQTGRAVLVDSAMVWSKTFYDPTGQSTDQYIAGEITEGDVISQARGVQVSLSGLALV